MKSITELSPKNLWHYFDKLNQIPRPSHSEIAVQDFVLNEAKILNLSAVRDDVGNIIIKKPATNPKSGQKTIILQAHLDMVAQKNPDQIHDFYHDPIKTQIKDNWVYATGTTLGADNGIGAAAILAILADNNIPHPPLEALFTASEETGMFGAKGLAKGLLTGDILFNLDSEQIDELCIGCAGGLQADFTISVEFTAHSNKSAYKLQISGLLGGHSGLDIDKNRGNANKILIEVIELLNKKQLIAVSEINGGSAHNAIARDAFAVFASDSNYQELQQQINLINQNLQQKYPSISVTINKTDIKNNLALTGNSLQKIINFINELPDGINNFDKEITGVIESSSNIALINLQKDCFSAYSLLRSTKDASKNELRDKMELICQKYQAIAKFSGNYPAWQPDVNNPINKIISNEIEKVIGKKPKANIIHAGLECGFFKQNYPNWQIVSFGPTIEMPHSPQERVEINSVKQFWQILCGSLARFV